MSNKTRFVLSYELNIFGEIKTFDYNLHSDKYYEYLCTTNTFQFCYLRTRYTEEELTEAYNTSLKGE